MTEHIDRHIVLSGADLEELAAAFRNRVDIRDRTYGFPAKVYKDCFVGAEAVQVLMEAGMAADVADALRVGNIMLESGVFHHVQRAHAFKNEYLFYRFAADEDHGELAEPGAEGGFVRWADFLGTPICPPGRQCLQADIPGPAAELAGMAQDDLAAVGVTPLDEHNAVLLDHVRPKKWIDPEPKNPYNLVVVGAGAGGLITAAGAAGVGARVAIVESHLLGGDCLNVGCVPSKALLRSARAAAAVRDAGRYGVRVEGDVTVDFGAVMERLRRIRARISAVDSARRYSEQLGVDVFLGKGRFTGPDSLEVNGRTLTFAKAVVATGGTAAIPNISGLAEAPYLTNSTVFNLTERPERFGVIGAGPIGMEMAQAFQRLGSEVTVFSRDDKVLPREEAEAVEYVQAAMREDGVNFIFRADFKRVEGSVPGEPVRVVIARAGSEESHEFDALLVATGRKPSVTGLGLEAAGVEFDERTGVIVNDQLQSSNGNIYAVGDVAGRYQFTHMADFMARMAIKNALFFGRDKVSDLLVPWVTYTDPEVAHVGLYEKDLIDREIGFSTYRREFEHVDRAIVDSATAGYVKIHVARGKDKILGATIVGSHAGEMISEISVAMQGGLGLGALASVIHPYPTAAEAIRQCGDAYNRERLTPAIKSILHRFMAMRR